MRLLKENYDGLQKIKELPHYLKDFLLLPNVKESLEDYNFTVLYRYAYNYLDLTKIHTVTELLYTLGINPLIYLDYIPKYFLAWTGIESIDIPDHIRRIEDSAFYSCKSLTSVIIPYGVPSIDHYTFYNCKSLTNIIIPNSVTSIGEFAFSRCGVLTNITISESATSIGDYAFYGCSSLTSVKIPNSVTSVGKYAFGACSSLTSIKYMGTKNQWSKIDFGDKWSEDSSIETIHCTDRDINL